MGRRRTQNADGCEADGLTDRERTFCQEYVLTLNATQAARKAGYAAGSCGVRGSEMLKKSNIREYLSKIRVAAESAAVLSLHEARVILADLARARVTDYLDADGQIEIHGRKGDRAVQSIEVTEHADGETATRRVTKFKLHDPVSAIAKLAALNGWDKPTKSDVTIRDEKRIAVGDIRPHAAAGAGGATGTPAATEPTGVGAGCASGRGEVMNDKPAKT